MPTIPIVFWELSNPLALLRSSRFTLHFLCPSSTINHFSKRLWFLQLENGKTTIWMLGVFTTRTVTKFTVLECLLLGKSLEFTKWTSTPLGRSPSVRTKRMIPLFKMLLCVMDSGILSFWSYQNIPYSDVSSEKGVGGCSHSPLDLLAVRI